MSVAPNVAVAAASSAVEIGLIVYGDVLYVSMMQSIIPAELQGRVFSVAYMIAFVLTPFGILFGGVVASLLGVRFALLASGVLSGACSFVIFVPGVRDPDRASTPGAAAK